MLFMGHTCFRSQAPIPTMYLNPLRLCPCAHLFRFPLPVSQLLRRTASIYIRHWFTSHREFHEAIRAVHRVRPSPRNFKHRAHTYQLNFWWARPVFTAASALSSLVFRSQLASDVLLCTKRDRPARHGLPSAARNTRYTGYPTWNGWNTSGNHCPRRTRIAWTFTIFVPRSGNLRDKGILDGGYVKLAAFKGYRV